MPVPYRLPQILDANVQTVYVVEGEKCADALNDLFAIVGDASKTATTVAGGSGAAGNWKSFAKFLAGREVYVLADDETEIDLAALNAAPNDVQIAPPPRSLSTSARVVALFAFVHLGMATFILFFLTVLIFFFFSGFQLSSAIYEKIGGWEDYASARIVSLEETSISINGQKALEIRFEGDSQEDGSHFSGRSYSF
ncbi:MAG: hypothetical protein HUK22_05800, partial [Thermoguttaceae bacterium]|nr:hypothetical protein [Thermoguttaceae bacterium]